MKVYQNLGPYLATNRGLTAGKNNDRLLAVDQKRLTAVMRGLGSGELKHPRFTKEEAAASGEVVHERLWNYILSLESPEVYFGGGEEGSARDGADDPKSGGWLGCFRRMATRYGSDSKEIAAGGEAVAKPSPTRFCKCLSIVLDSGIL